MNQISNLSLVDVEREISKRSLSDYTKLAWPHIEVDEYIHNWHMDAIAEHLMATASGDITRLLINVPPGTSKSTATCVFFPSWLWGPGGWPEARFVGASHELSNATRDNRKTRTLIESEWYQDRWPMPLATDQNIKNNFENTMRGFRSSTAVRSMTGKRGHFVVWDDPLSVTDAKSDTKRNEANEIFAETLTTRLVDPKKSVIIIIMQRLHEDDVSGYILANNMGYEHLMLPMEYEAARCCKTIIGFEDPRAKEGELLFEKRFPRDVVERDKRAMGSYATAGQFQQRPAPRGGGLFKKSDFQYVDSLPNDLIFVRAWDLAATDVKEDRDAAYTVGLLMGWSRSLDAYFVVDVEREQASPARVEVLMQDTAKNDKVQYKRVHGSIPQDPGQAGKAQVRGMISKLAGHSYRATPESGDKYARAEPFAAQVEAKNVFLLKGAWNRDYVDELSLFPAGKLKDQVDASSRAFMELVERKPKRGAVSGTQS